MGQPVQQGRRHTFALEDLAPFTERQVAGDQQAGSFIAIGEDLEQQFGAGAAEGEVSGPARTLGKLGWRGKGFWGRIVSCDMLLHERILYAGDGCSGCGQPAAVLR